MSDVSEVYIKPCLALGHFSRVVTLSRLSCNENTSTLLRAVFARMPILPSVGHEGVTGFMNNAVKPFLDSRHLGSMLGTQKLLCGIYVLQK